MSKFIGNGGLSKLIQLILNLLAGKEDNDIDEMPMFDVTYLHENGRVATDGDKVFAAATVITNTVKNINATGTLEVTEATTLDDIRPYFDDALTAEGMTDVDYGLIVNPDGSTDQFTWNITPPTYVSDGYIEMYFDAYIKNQYDPSWDVLTSLTIPMLLISDEEKTEMIMGIESISDKWTGPLGSTTLASWQNTLEDIYMATGTRWTYSSTATDDELIELATEITRTYVAWANENVYEESSQSDKDRDKYKAVTIEGLVSRNPGNESKTQFDGGVVVGYRSFNINFTYTIQGTTHTYEMNYLILNQDDLDAVS